MKQEFEMTQEEMDDILAINNNRMPVMRIGDVTTGLDLQGKINNYWKGLSDKYGFRQMTVEESSRGKLFFLAEPKPIVKPKTKEEIAVDEYICDAMDHVNYHVTNPLKKIVEQLDSCNYECKGGYLKDNTAFRALVKMSGLPC